MLAALNDPDSFRSRVFFPYLEMIRLWQRQPAFHPKADFAILDADPGIFAIRRSGGEQRLAALTNITPRSLTVDLKAIGVNDPAIDLVADRRIESSSLTLAPYQFVWLDHG